MAFFNSPEELAAHLQEQHAQRHLHMQDHIHARTDFLMKLSKEDLDLVDTLILQSMDDKFFAGYLRGQIGLIAQQKGHQCLCGHDHDAELVQNFMEGTPDNASKSSPESVDTTTPDRVESDTKPALSGAARDAAMREYGLEQVNPDEQPNHPTGIRCINCRQMYVSLEDRMLREPGIDGCGGCQIKSAHGGWQGE